MICPSCVDAADYRGPLKVRHCGKPGEKTPSCSCQHNPPGTRQAVELEDEGS